MAHYIDGFPGREITVKGSKYHYFGGTSYLGLQTDLEYQDLFIKNLRQYGTNYGASRKSNIRLSVYEKSESLLADTVGSASALTLSSGYLAGQFVAQNFNKPEYKLFYAPNTHSALYNNYNKPYTDFIELKCAILEHLKSNNKVTPVVFIDSVDFSGQNYPDFNGLKTLPLDKIIIVADDSHGIGIIGNNGEGVFRTLLGFKPKELIVCCSLGKGYAIQAGAVFGTEDRIEQLGNTAFFGGASPAAPSSMATFLDGQDIYNKKRVQLFQNMSYFEKTIHQLDFFNHMHGHPTYSFNSPKLADYLEENGHIITNFNYPAESSSVMSRIVLSSHHTKKDMDRFSLLLNSFL
tara:strand:- start:9243 stop:10289 length:1047 start_codon:yes stop_codon:yes gene_type:complete